MSRDLTDADQAKLLARAQKLEAALLSDFGAEARPHWDAQQAERFKYAGDGQQLRKQLIDASLAEVIQRGARSRRGILRIWPNGDAPDYVPRERGTRR